MSRPSDPVGAPFWWHLTDEEQRSYRLLTAERQEALRRVKALESLRENLRRGAHQRCKSTPDHLHSMKGLVDFPSTSG